VGACCGVLCSTDQNVIAVVCVVVLLGGGAHCNILTCGLYKVVKVLVF
jgi:hypothetical protein